MHMESTCPSDREWLWKQVILTGEFGFCEQYETAWSRRSSRYLEEKRSTHFVGCGGNRLLYSSGAVRYSAGFVVKSNNGAVLSDSELDVFKCQKVPSKRIKATTLASTKAARRCVALPNSDGITVTFARAHAVGLFAIHCNNNNKFRKVQGPEFVLKKLWSSFHLFSFFVAILLLHQ